MLHVLDEKWKDHLYDLDQLRNAIGYRSWGQKDPLIEYKQEAYTMFVDLMSDIHNTFSEGFLKAQAGFEPTEAPPPPPPPRSDEAVQRDGDSRGGSGSISRDLKGRWTSDRPSRRPTPNRGSERVRTPRSSARAKSGH